MRKHAWMALIIVALAGVVIWQQVTVARMQEEYRCLRDRQERVERLVERIPDMMRSALDRHRMALIAYMEGKEDGR